MSTAVLSSIFLFTYILLSGNFAFANANNTAQQFTQIDLQLKWRHQFQFAGYYMAKEKGYYRKYGLEVNLIERTTGPSPIEKLSYGDVDYAIGAAGAIVYRANGVPLVALASFFQHSPSLLISRYPKLSDLINKKVMITKGLMNAEIIAMFKKYHLHTSKMNIIATEESLTEFIKGNVDAYNVYASNELYSLNKKGVEFYAFRPSDHGINFYGDVLLTLENRVDNKPEEVEHIRAATIEGWRYAINNIDETINLIVEKYNSQNKTKAELTFEAQQLIELMYADIIPLGYMNSERWEAILLALQEVEILDNPQVDLNRFIYSSTSDVSVWQALVNFKTQALVLLVILFTIALIFHNRRLKVKIREHTQQLDHERVKAEKDARTDSLTQLGNRRKFMEGINHDLSIAARNKLDFSITYIDIDFFKTINDTYGHAAGDKVLQELADILKNNTRPSDNVARIGGEEFSITSLGKNKNTAAALADRIRKKVEEHTFMLGGEEVKITISLGVSTLTDTQTSDELLKSTDDALYKAKNLGRNQVQVA